MSFRGCLSVLVCLLDCVHDCENVCVCLLNIVLTCVFEHVHVCVFEHVYCVAGIYMFECVLSVCLGLMNTVC